MTRRITLMDVARRAGVHYTTVSMALRNHPRLPTDTRERLRTLAEEMGYQPDPMLKALNDYRSGLKSRRRIATLAYVTNWTTRWGWKRVWPHGEYFAGAEARAIDLGYQLEHFWLGEPGLTHQRLSAMLQARGIVGVIIASHCYELDAPLQFDWSKFSGVKIDHFPHEPALHHVTCDRSSAIRVVIRRLKAAGYRRIGFAMHRLWDHNADLAWSSGFLAEQQLIPRSDQVPMFIFPDSLLHATNVQLDCLAPRDEFETWMRRYSPDALISTAAFVKPHLDAMGISIPRDLVFADVELHDLDGKVAGIRQNSRRVGEIAVEILTGQLQQHSAGLPELPTATLVDGTWFDGESLPGRQLGASISDARLVAVGGR